MVTLGGGYHQEISDAFQSVPGGFRRSHENSETFKGISRTPQVVLGSLRSTSWVVETFQGIS